MSELQEFRDEEEFLTEAEWREEQMRRQRLNGARCDGNSGRAVPETEKPFLRFRASDFAGREAPPREFIDGRRFFPANEVSFVSGAGAVGKTLLMLQLAASVCLPLKPRG